MPKRGENIYKRKDGRWEGRYKKRADLSGKVLYGYVYSKSYAEVKKKLFAAKAGAAADVSFPDETLGSACMKWFNENKNQFKASTCAKYNSIIKNHIMPTIGMYSLCLLNNAVIRKYVDEKLKCGECRSSGGLSAKTVKDILSVLRLSVNYAVSEGFSCGVNFESIKIKSPENSIEVLSVNEQQILTDYLTHNMSNTSLAILLCMYTGLRIGEVCALKFEDIQMEDGIIYVKKTMQRIQNTDDEAQSKTAVFVTPPKSFCLVRDIPLPDFLREIILKNGFYNSKAYVATGEVFSFAEPRTLENRFKACLRECGLKNFKFHSLRHTFATRCVEMGFEIKSLSEILGHSSVNITLDRYVHSSMELKKRNMEKLNLLPSNF